jgi:transcriptional regulator with XRE-family HTH domain
MNESNYFGSNLQKHRTDLKLSRAELAKEIGVSAAIVRHWEQGEGSPALRYLIRIRDFLQIDLDSLIREDKMKIVSYNIAHLRRQMGMTQERLADKLDITRSRLSSWEEHRAEPNVTYLIRISDFFEVNVDTLIKTDLRNASK